MITRASKFFGVSALLAAMLPAIHANAAGFQVSEHSAAGLGRAFAGEAAVADDASVVARNPAGMSKIDSTMVTVVGSYIMPEIELEDKNGSSAGSKSVANEAFVPAAYMVWPYNDRWTFGFGGFSNFGFTTNVGSNSSLIYEAHESEIITMNLNASVAYQMNDRLSFGFGLNAVHTEANLFRSVDSSTPIFGLNPALHGNTALDMTGEDWGFGWNAGILFDLTPATRVGLSYRSEVDQTLEGKSKSQLNETIASMGNSNFRGDGSVDLTLPAVAEISVNHQLTDTISIQASVMRTFWSSFEEIHIDMENGSYKREPQNWEDVNRYSLGVTWVYSNQLTLRAGIAKDESPIAHDTDRYFSIPDADRMWYTIGATYKMDEHHTFDFGYAYLSGDKADVYHMQDTKQGEVVNSTANIFALQYNYKF